MTMKALRLTLRFVALFLCFASIGALALLLQGGNPTIVQGGSSSFTSTGTQSPATGRTWDILNSAGTTVAHNASGSTNGWTVSLSGSTFVVSAPADATVGTNYKVRYTTDQQSGGGPLAYSRSGDLISSAAGFDFGETVALQAGGSKSAIFDVVAAVPAAPSSLTATSISTTQINLSWTDNSNTETGFKIERKTGSGGTWSQIHTTATGATSYQNTGLTSNTQYYYRVRATNGGSVNSGYSNEANAWTRHLAPGSLTATAGDATVTLSWSLVSGATYTIKRATAIGGPYTQVVTGHGSTTYQNSGLTNGITYYFVVTADNAAGPSANSNEASATPVAGLAAPANVSVSLIDGQQFEVTWDAVSGAEEYVVETNTDLFQNNPWEASEPVNTTVATLTGAANKVIYVRVIARNPQTSSAPSTGVNVTTEPTVPTGVSAEGGLGQITVFWDEQSRAVTDPPIEFKMLRSTTTGGPYTYVGSTYNGTSYQDSVAPNVPYYYVVRAQNSAGSSTDSVEVSAEALSVPDAPGTLSAKGSNALIELSWPSVSSAITYKVKRSPDQAGPFSVVYETTLTSHQDLVDEDETYYYRVSAVNTAGESADSQTVGATAHSVHLSAFATSSTSTTLYWREFPGASGYNVRRSLAANGTYSLIASNILPIDPGPGLSGRFQFTDSNLVEGTQYFYEVSPIFPSGSEGGGSNIPSAVPSALAIPWNSSPSAIIEKLHEVFSGTVSGWNVFGFTKAVGPNGVIYYELPDGTTGTSENIKTLHSVTNIITDASYQQDYPKIFDGYFALQEPSPVEVGMGTAADGRGTGVHRKVEAAHGRFFITGSVFLPPVADQFAPHWDTLARDTGWIYTGGDGQYQATIGRSRTVTRSVHVDFGFSKGWPDSRKFGWGPDGWIVRRNSNNERIREALALSNDRLLHNVAYAADPRTRARGWFMFNLTMPNGAGSRFDQTGVFTVTPLAGGAFTDLAGNNLNLPSLNCVATLPDIHSVAGTADGSRFRFKRVNGIAQNTTGAFPPNVPAPPAGFYHRYPQGVEITGGAWGSAFDDDLGVRVNGALLEGNVVSRAGAGPFAPAGPNDTTAPVTRNILFPYYAEDQITVRTRGALP